MTLDDFDSMTKAEEEPYWLNFEDTECVLSESDGEDTEEKQRWEGAFVGELTEVEKNVGDNGSRLYTFRGDDVDRPVKMWGKGHINNQVEDAGITVGDTVGIRPLGDTMDVGEDNEMQLFDVRYSKN